MAHALAANLGARNFDAALVANDALIADPLVLAAGAFPVLLRTEDALTEQSVPFRFECSVVDGLWLGYFTSRPGADLVWRGESNSDRVKIIYF